MDSKGRCLDNIYIERFWRSLKQEEVYLNPYDNISEARTGIASYIEFYVVMWEWDNTLAFRRIFSIISKWNTDTEHIAYIPLDISFCIE
jgi:transposase InsO family protein